MGNLLTSHPMKILKGIASDWFISGVFYFRFLFMGSNMIPKRIQSEKNILKTPNIMFIEKVKI